MHDFMTGLWIFPSIPFSCYLHAEYYRVIGLSAGIGGQVSLYLACMTGRINTPDELPCEPFAISSTRGAQIKNGLSAI